MLLLRIFRRILCIIFIVNAAAGQKDKEQQHELMNDASNLRSLLHTMYANTQKSQIHKGHESEKATKHRYVEQWQTESGNSLAAREIAMEILSEMFPSTTKGYDDVFKGQQLQSPTNRWRAIKRLLSGERANFRDFDSNNAKQQQQQWQQQQQQQDAGHFNAELSNWHENTKSVESNADFTPAANQYNNSPSSKHELNAQTFIWNWLLHHNNDDDDDAGDDLFRNFQQKFTDNFMKSISREDSEANAVKGTFNAPIVTRKNVEQYDDVSMGAHKSKRNPLAIDEHRFEARYPFAFYQYAINSDKADGMGQIKLLSSKRERTPPMRTSFMPSISAGAMTNLGTFFGDLSKNVHFNEQQELHESKVKLLEGDHPLRVLQKEVEGEADENAKIDKTAQFLQAIRSYRPSQKIRSLVSMNPQGYHGSNFLDPNYMWVGLG